MSLATTHQVTLMDTSYYGEVVGITPEASDADEEIVIAGQAIERDTQTPIGQVPLKLVITVQAFERTYGCGTPLRF